MDKIKKIKKIHSIFSIILFLSLVIFCTYVSTNLKLCDISLSKFGIYPKTNHIWNTTLFIIGILLLIDVLYNLNKFFKKNKYYNSVKVLFIISNVNLLLTACINMNYCIHNYTALGYFLGFTISIFLFGYNLLKSSFRIGILSIVFSILSAFIPIILYYNFKGLAIPEIVHSIFILLWLISLTFDVEVISILKRFGF